MTCLKSLEASKSQSHTAKINFGFMSTIVYDGDFRPKLIFAVRLCGFEASGLHRQVVFLDRPLLTAPVADFFVHRNLVGGQILVKEESGIGYSNHTIISIFELGRKSQSTFSSESRLQLFRSDGSQKRIQSLKTYF